MFLLALSNESSIFERKKPKKRVRNPFTPLKSSTTTTTALLHYDLSSPVAFFVRLRTTQTPKEKREDEKPSFGDDVSCGRNSSNGSSVPLFFLVRVEWCVSVFPLPPCSGLFPPLPSCIALHPSFSFHILDWASAPGAITTTTGLTVLCYAPSLLS